MSSACCPVGGHISTKVTSQPRGTTVTQDGTRMYIVNPSNPDSKKTIKAGLIVVPDITGFGGDHSRIRLIADFLANYGYQVVLPDVFHGLDWTPNLGFEAVPPYIKRFPWIPTEGKKGLFYSGQNDFTNCCTYLNNNGVNKIGMVTFCWGSYWAVWAAGTGLLECTVNLHPSHPNVLKGNQDDERDVLEHARCPQLFISGGNDLDAVKAGGLADEILNATVNPNDISLSSRQAEFIEYPDMLHGWVTRGSLTDPAILRDHDDALAHTKSYLARFLTEPQA